MSKITHKEAKEVQNTLPHSPHLCPCLIPRSPDTLGALFYLQGYRTLNHTGHLRPFSYTQEPLFQEGPLMQCPSFWPERKFRADQ